MELELQHGGEQKTFISHVFDGTPEGNDEYMNVAQYAVMGVVPIIVLNKLIQTYIPDVDLDKSSLELMVEIALQIVIMFAGVIIIHRAITYFPTYSGFKYESLTATNVVLAFLIIIFLSESKISNESCFGEIVKTIGGEKIFSKEKL